MFPIYLDNAATTKMDKSLMEIYQFFSCDNFYNASAGYYLALSNSKKLDEARNIILKKMGAKEGDIIFTGCATEGNNLAIRGSLREGKWEYVFSKGEHPSVYNVAKNLQLNEKNVHLVGLQKNGQVDYKELEDTINDKTRLVSVMFVSNETGAVNDIRRVCEIVKSKNPKTLIHVDAVQGFCKIPFKLSDWNVDFLTISAHKFHGPKGVGALYVRNKSVLKSITFGGGQEFGLRSGTENLAGIMAMTQACENINVKNNLENVSVLRQIFLSQIDLSKVSYIQTESPYICSLSFPNVNGETLMRALENDVIIGTGSACSTKKAGNRILESMGFGNDYIKSSVRISFNAYQSVEEVEMAGKIIMKKYLEILERVK